MAITLRVSSYHGQHLGPDATRIFESSGTIGRTPKSDWVLPDPDRFISGEHVKIFQRGGDYYLKDLSSNGTQINGRNLPRGSEVPISNGDVVGIGDYEISVMIDASMPEISGIDDPRGEPDLPPSDLSGSSSVDPLNFIPEPGQAAASKAASAAQPNHVPSHQQFFEPEPMTRESEPPEGGEIPANWWEVDVPASGERKPESQSRVPPPETPNSPSATFNERLPERPRHAPSSGDGIDALLHSAGIDPAQVNADVRQAMGKILRITVQGMVELLQSRAEFKNQFRVARTTLKSTDNNPLKLSANAEDALFNLFAKPIPGYKGAAEAFQEGFDDLRAHQMAVMAGMKAGFRSVVSHFDPERLEEHFDRGLKRGRILDVVNKTKYWELYREEWGKFGGEDEAFRLLFAEEFGKAYEQQMQRLTNTRSR